VVDFDILDPDLWATGDPARHGVPYDELEILRSEAPCLRYEVNTPGFLPWAWVITRHEDAVRINRDAGRFLSGHGVTLWSYDALGANSESYPNMLAMDGDNHSRLRKVISAGFSPQVIRAFEGVLDSICEAAFDEALAEGTVDFVKTVSAPVPLNALSDLFGVPDGDRRNVLNWVNTYTVPTDPDYSPSHEDVLRAVDALCDYALTLLNKRRESPGEDVMSKIAIAHDSGAMTEEEVMGMTLLLLAAGNETTRNAISHGVHALVRNRDQMLCLRENVETHAKLAVEEILRIASPVVYQRRTALEPLELHGQSIAAGDRVVFMHAAANFDPRVFSEPLAFDITREPNRHMTFGSGPHMCLGATVARLEIKCVLRQLVERTADVQLAGDISYARDSFLRGVKRLPLKLLPS
jgi:cholest-4-en-3-one 26-monooxygenase